MDYQKPPAIEVKLDCQERMKQAMQAMDEFIQPTTSVDAIYRLPSQSLRLAAEREARRERAVALWEQVKLECWGKP
jgi:hypothetical protein